MGFLDRLLGREDTQDPRRRYAPEPGSYGPTTSVARPDSDEAAVERYRYLLRTAPPDAIEQAHAEAFAQLTPEQRRGVLAQVSAEVPESERVTSDDPRQLARMATRAELRSPGTLERSLGPGAGGMGMGMGGMIAGSLLASVAGAFVGTAIADSLFDLSDSGGQAEADLPSADGTDAGDVSADGGGWFDDGFGGDFGGDFGGEF